MSTSKSKRFIVVSSGRDEYPGNGLYLCLLGPDGRRVPGSELMDKRFMDHMGISLQEDDIVEVYARIESRLVTKREHVEPAEHVCGLSGYNGMVDPPCPRCEARKG